MVPGNFGLKLHGDLTPLCRKGRNIEQDLAWLDTSIPNREAEWDATPMRERDLGHWMRIENEKDTRERCKDKCPEKEKQPQEFLVPDEWLREVDKHRNQMLGTAGVALVGAAALALAPETGGLSLVLGGVVLAF